MAGSLNKVLLIGRLGNDPEIKQMQNGKSVARLSVATSESWKDKNTGEKKEKTEWVMVEALSQFKVTYMVEVPVGKTEYALDTVTMEQAKEFSQEHLRPTDIILGHRVLSKEEALKLCDERNEYSSSWNEETKIKNFFTTWSEQNESK